MKQSMTQNGQKPYQTMQSHAEEMQTTFESVFTDMAYQAFNIKHTELMPHLVTFQVIVSDIDKKSASGAFILQVNQDPIYVPVCLVENKLKPMEIMYSKRLDKFMPLNDEWMATVAGSASNAYGEAVPANSVRSTYTNDPTKLLQPPMAGGIFNGMTGNPHAGMTVLASVKGAVPSFTEFLKVASNETKKRFVDYLAVDKEFLKFAAEVTDTEALVDAVKKNQEEVTTIPPKYPEELSIVDMDSSVEEIKAVFGNHADKAAKDIALKGFSFKDTRKNTGYLYNSQKEIALAEVSENGYYDVMLTTGEFVPAMVIVSPSAIRLDGLTVSQHIGRASREYVPKLCVLADGTYTRVTSSKLVASPCKDLAAASKLFAALLKPLADVPNCSLVTLVNVDGYSVRDGYTEGFLVSKQTKDGVTSFVAKDEYVARAYERATSPEDKARLCSAEYYDSKLVALKEGSGKNITVNSARTILVKPQYKAIILKPHAGTSLVTRAQDVLSLIEDTAGKYGSSLLTLSSRGAGEFSINGEPAGSIKTASEKLARNYEVSFESAYNAIKDISRVGASSKVLVIPSQEKIASIFGGTPGTQMSPDMISEDMMQQQQQQMPMDPMAMQQMQQQMPMDPMAMQQMQAPMGPMDMQQMPMVQDAMQMQDPELFNLGVIKAISQDPHVSELIAEYIPSLETAMDKLGRLLLTLWIDGKKHINELGEEQFKAMEGSARNAFNELGSLLTKISKSHDIQ